MTTSALAASTVTLAQAKAAFLAGLCFGSAVTLVLALASSRIRRALRRPPSSDRSDIPTDRNPHHDDQEIAP